MNARVKWTDGHQFVGESQTGHAIVMDSTEGADTAASPMELVLQALCGCTGMDLVSILQKMKKDLRKVEVSANAERTEDYPRVFTRIHLHYRIEGKGVDRESVEKAIRLSEDKYCSVAAMLRKGVAMSTDYEVVETA
jgi:putative redox protein